MRNLWFLTVPVSVCFGLAVTIPACGVLAQDEIKYDRDESFARRTLKREELAEIVRLSDLVIDKNSKRSQRCFRAIDLGNKYGHRTCLPALLAVVRDESDEPSVRRACAVSLTFIPDRRVIDELIELLLDKHANLAFAIHNSMIALTHIGIGGDEFKDRDPESPGRKKVHRQWRTWWKKNRETAKLYWSDAFGSMPVASGPIQPYEPDEEDGAETLDESKEPDQ